jgi:hypothetical protein
MAATGVVTGVATGSVTITYTVTNAGGCINTATKNITVGPAPAPGPSKNTDTVLLSIGSEIMLNTHSGVGSWSCQDCNGIVALNTETGSVTGIEPGLAILTYAETSEETTMITITYVLESSLPENLTGPSGHESGLSLFPNPNKGEFMVKGMLGGNEEQEVTLEVDDMLGQVVYKNAITARAGKINIPIILGGNLPNGMYILNLRSAEGNSIFHFVLEQ